MKIQQKNLIRPKGHRIIKRIVKTVDNAHQIVNQLKCTAKIEKILINFIHLIEKRNDVLYFINLRDI